MCKCEYTHNHRSQTCKGRFALALGRPYKSKAVASCPKLHGKQRARWAAPPFFKFYHSPARNESLRSGLTAFSVSKCSLRRVTLSTEGRQGLHQMKAA